MIFSNSLFSKQNINNEEELSSQIIDKLNNEIFSNLQKKNLKNLSNIFKTFLKTFPETIFAKTFHIAILSIESNAILELANALTSIQSSKLFMHFIKEIQPQNRKDKVLIFLLQLYKQSQNQKIQKIIYGKIKKITGDKRVKAIFEILQGKIPDPPSHIIFAKETVSIPLLKTLINFSSHSEKEVRKAVIVTLGFFPEIEERVIMVLLKALYEKSSSICKAAATSLSQIGKEILPLVVKELDSKNPKVRTAVAWIIGKFKSEALIATEKLIDKLGDTDKRVRKPVKWALVQIGTKAIPFLLKSAKECQDPEILMQIISILGEIKEDLPEVSNFLIQMSQKDSIDIQIEAVKSLGLITSELGKDIIIQCMENQEKSLQLTAIKALQNYNTTIEKTSHKLLEFAKSEDQKVQIAAIKALKQVGIRSTQELKTLVALLDEENIEKTKIIITTLKTFKSKAEKALPYIINIMKNAQDKELIILIIDTIGAIGKEARKTISILLKIINSDDNEIRSACANAIKKIGLETSKHIISIAMNSKVEVKNEIVKAMGNMHNLIPELISEIQGKSSQRRQIAAEVLGELGEPAFKKLIPLLSSQDFWIKKAATRALEKNGKAVVKHLANAIKGNNCPHLNSSAFSIINKMRYKVLAEVIPFINDPNEKISQYAVKFIEKVDPNYEDTIPDLIALLDSPNEFIRQTVVWCLGKIGKNSEEVMNTLHYRKENDDDHLVRKFSGQALMKITS